MPGKHSYRIRTVWTGAAQGPTATYDRYARDYTVEAPGKAVLKGSADAAFRGDAALYNPEDWLLAALSACHMLSYLAICGRARIPVASYEDEAAAEMIEDHGGGHFLEAVLRPRVTIADATLVERARWLHDLAHKQCYIANSVNFPVRVEATVTALASAPQSDRLAG